MIEIISGSVSEEVRMILEKINQIQNFTRFVAIGMVNPDQLKLKIEGDLHLPDEIEDEVTEYWRKRLQLTPHLFDGRVLHADNWQFGEENLIRLLRTSFSRFDYTRSVEFSRKFFQYSELVVRALSAQSIIVTSDDYILLDRRGAKLTFTGKLHTVGGNAEVDKDIENVAFRECKEEIGNRLAGKLGIDKLICIQDDILAKYFQASIVVKCDVDRNETLELLQTGENAIHPVFMKNDPEVLASELADQDKFVNTGWGDLVCFLTLYHGVEFTKSLIQRLKS